MAGARALYVYTSDDTTDYNVSLDSSNALAAGFAAAAAGSRDTRPVRMKLRYALLQHPTTGRERKLPIPTADNAIYVGTTATVTITDFTTTPSANIAYNVRGLIGERRLA